MKKQKYFGDVAAAAMGCGFSRDPKLIKIIPNAISVVEQCALKILQATGTIITTVLRE